MLKFRTLQWHDIAKWHRRPERHLYFHTLLWVNQSQNVLLKKQSVSFLWGRSGIGLPVSGFSAIGGSLFQCPPVYWEAGQYPCQLPSHCLSQLSQLLQGVSTNSLLFNTKKGQGSCNIFTSRLLNVLEGNAFLTEVLLFLVSLLSCSNERVGSSFVPLRSVQGLGQDLCSLASDLQNCIAGVILSHAQPIWNCQASDSVLKKFKVYGAVYIDHLESI